MGLFDRLFGKKASRIEVPAAEPAPVAAPIRPAEPAPQPKSAADTAREEEGLRAMTELLDEMVLAVAQALAAQGQNNPINLVYVMAAVAGQVAQAGAIRSRALAGEPLEAPHVVAVEATNGRTYLFGDAIGMALIGEVTDPGVLWQSAGTSGLPFDQQIINELFSHAASTVGSADFGRPRFGVELPPDLTIDAAVRHIGTIVPSLTKRGVGQNLWTRMTALATRHAILAAAREHDMEALGHVALDAAVAGSRIRFEDIAKG
ncbi:hypothetical protein ACFB49_03360 [Sphingomonas sp. DBB INV C78]|uniref:hypothetical protein n=1 Tax=Sphingomonas sp. DBB INV C78 TaxID=3349434 RepID=UPI0036D4297D